MMGSEPITGAQLNDALALIAALSNPDAVKKALDKVKEERGNVEELFKNASDAQMQAERLKKDADQILIVANAKADENAQKSAALDKQSTYLADRATALANSERNFELSTKATRDELTRREVAVVAREGAVEKRENAIADRENEAAALKAEYEAKLSALRNAVA